MSNVTTDRLLQPVSHLRGFHKVQAYTVLEVRVVPNNERSHLVKTTTGCVETHQMDALKATGLPSCRHRD